MFEPYVLPEIILVISGSSETQSGGFIRQGKVVLVHQPCLMFRRPASLLTRNFQNTYSPPTCSTLAAKLFTSRMMLE